MKNKFSSSRQVLIITACIVVASIVLAACSKSNDNSTNTPVAALMAFNLAPDKSSIGIRLSGNNLTQVPLSYGAYTGGYASIYPGTSAVEAYDNNNTTFTSNPFTFDTSHYFSLFVIGNAGNYKNVIVRDNFDSLMPAAGTAYVRYINAIPDSTKPVITVSANGSTVVNAAAGFSTVSQFVAVAAGNVNVGVTNEGTINTSRSLTFIEKKVYTLLLLGNPAATDTTAKPQIRFIENGGL